MSDYSLLALIAALWKQTLPLIHLRAVKSAGPGNPLQQYDILTRLWPLHILLRPLENAENLVTPCASLNCTLPETRPVCPLTTVIALQTPPALL